MNPEMQRFIYDFLKERLISKENFKQNNNKLMDIFCSFRQTN